MAASPRTISSQRFMIRSMPKPFIDSRQEEKTACQKKEQMDKEQLAAKDQPLPAPPVPIQSQASRKASQFSLLWAKGTGGLGK